MAVSRGKGTTYEEYRQLPDDGLRYELIGGEIYMSPPPTIRHQQVLGRLHLQVASHLEAQGGGEVFLAPCEVNFFHEDALQPDLIFVSESQAGIVTEANILGVPALVVEVLSDPSRDRKLKKHTYERHGVPEYWIVDPGQDQIEVYRLENRRYGAPNVLDRQDRLSTTAIPGLTLDLGHLFQR